MDIPNLQYKEIREPSFAYQLTDGICRLKKNDTLCDITIDVEGQKFPCHKVVLASISSYFEAMFTSSMKEGKSAEIEMKDMEPLVFETILDFIYTGKCKVSIDNAQAIMNAANMLEILALKKICSNYIAENLTPQNCLPIWQFADAISYRELILKAEKFSLESFWQVPPSLVTSLSKDILIQYIANNLLNIHSEDNVAEVALQWIEAEPERKTDAVEVLSHVRFSMVSSRYLMALLKHEIIKSNEPILKLIHQAQLFQSDPTMYFELPYPQASPRYSLKQRECVLLLATETDGTSISKMTFSMAQPKWQVQQSGLQGFKDAAICSSTVNSEVFVSGGKDNPTKLITFKAEHKPRFKKELPTMLTGRQNHTMVMIGGCLHIIGGLEIVSSDKLIPPAPVTNRPVGGPSYSVPVTNMQHETFVVSKIEVYNIQQSKWRSAGNLLTGVWEHASVSFQDNIYTFGGYTYEKTASNKVQIFSHHGGECVLGPEIPSAITKCSATVMEESIFVFGLGENLDFDSNSDEDDKDCGSEEQYDQKELYQGNPVFYQFKPLDGVWIKLTSPTYITNSALCTFQGKIWNIVPVVGSETKVHFYDHVNDMWVSNSDESEDNDESEYDSVKCMQITYTL